MSQHTQIRDEVIKELDAIHKCLDQAEIPRQLISTKLVHIENLVSHCGCEMMEQKQEEAKK